MRGVQQRGSRCTDIGRDIVRAFDAPELVYWRMGLGPRLVKELEIASGKAVVQPPLSGLVEDGETIEEGDAVLGERERVLGDAGVVETGRDEQREGKREYGRSKHGGQRAGAKEREARVCSEQVLGRKVAEVRPLAMCALEEAETRAEAPGARQYHVARNGLDAVEAREWWRELGRSWLIFRDGGACRAAGCG